MAGTVLLQRAPALPDIRLAPLALAAALGLALARRSFARLALVALAGLVLGWDLAAVRAQARLADELPPAWEGRDIEIEGVVAGLPQPGERGRRFVFAPDRVATAGVVVPSLVSLTAYSEEGSRDPSPALAARAGERWRLTVRLKRPRGLATPHAFDVEPWSFARSLRATGYVRASPVAQRLSGHEPGWPQSLHRYREGVRDGIRDALGEGRFAGVVAALVMGDQDAIDAADWRTFWRTGIGHVVSISGLHVTMLAALAFGIVAFAWARVPQLARRWPSRRAGLLVGVAAGLAYCLVAGYGVPAQRTAIMLAVAAAAAFAGRHSSASRVLAWAALAVVAIDPWAVLAPGFWLSFGAVGAILLATGLRTGSARPFAGAVAAQVATGLALLAPLAALFGEASVVSPVANAFAIPLVSFVIVPLAIAGGLLGWDAPLAWAHGIIEAGMGPLEWLAGLPWAVIEFPAPPSWAVALALAGSAVALAPRGWPLRLCGLVLGLPLVLHTGPAPATGEAWVDVIDVGQGQAVAVRTASHALLVDAGPAWGRTADAGERVVVPFLRGEGVRRLDGIAVTHADDDHAGGAASVIASRDPAWLLSPLSPRSALHGLTGISRLCVAGLRWEWDGVRFVVLHPGARAIDEARRRENDRSCVIRVETAGGSALLAADVERGAEAEIVAAHGKRLRSEVLVVPHHGSRTSSTPAFIDAVAPAVAVVSAGWRNRFRHPSPEVLARYRARGIGVLRTDVDGAIRIVLPAVGDARLFACLLVPRFAYWSDRGKNRGQVKNSPDPEFPGCSMGPGTPLHLTPRGSELQEGFGL